MTTRKTLIAASLITILAACGGSGSSNNGGTTTPDDSFAFDATPMITNLTDNVIVAGYADLAVKAEAALQAAQTLVNTPNQANLKAAQDAWKAARQPWEQGESHIFGPVDSLGIDPHLDTWPLNTTDLQTVLSSNSGFDADTIREWNDDVQGFHTMEFLLFGDGVDDNEKDIAEMTAKERDYLMAVAEVFRDYAVALDDAWQVSHNAQDANAKPYATLVKEPGTDGNNFYSSELAVVEELINGLIGIVDEVGNGKIADPLGEDISSADTSKVESQYSWNSLADFADNIKGVRNVYQGEFSGGDDEPGLIDFVMAADAELATRISTEIDDAIISIQNIEGSTGMPFRQAILDEEGRQRVQVAVDSLTTLMTTFESDVLPLLSRWNQ